MFEQDLIKALDPVIFAKEDLGIDPDEWQRQALGYHKQLILLCSRQAGKSTVASIKALHKAIYKPKSLSLLISPSLRQSGELFKTVKGMFKTIDKRPELIEDNKLSLTMQNGSRIVSLPNSEETIRGFAGVDLLILDEASRIPDEVYRAVRPFLAVSGGELMLLSTPYGQRGFYYETWANGLDTWKRIKITAEDCPRISPEFLQEERQALGQLYFEQEYLCKFLEDIGGFFRLEDFDNCLSDEVEIFDL